MTSLKFKINENIFLIIEFCSFVQSSEMEFGGSSCQMSIMRFVVCLSGRGAAVKRQRFLKFMSTVNPINENGFWSIVECMGFGGSRIERIRTWETVVIALFKNELQVYNSSEYPRISRAVILCSLRAISVKGLSMEEMRKRSQQFKLHGLNSVRQGRFDI